MQIFQTKCKVKPEQDVEVWFAVGHINEEPELVGSRVEDGGTQLRGAVEHAQYCLIHLWVRQINPRYIVSINYCLYKLIVKQESMQFIGSEKQYYIDKKTLTLWNKDRH